MQALSDDDLAKVYSSTRVPELSVVVQATKYVASRATAAAADRTLTPVPSSPGLPGPGPIQSQCNSVDYTPGTRYALLVAKEVANSILGRGGVGVQRGRPGRERLFGVRPAGHRSGRCERFCRHRGVVQRRGRLGAG
jgi:hypothetical protein